MTLTAKDVAEITRLLEESSFDELYLELDGVKLSLKRNGAAGRAWGGPSAAAPGNAPSLGSAPGLGNAPSSGNAPSPANARTPGNAPTLGNAPARSPGTLSPAPQSSPATTGASAADPNVHNVTSPLLGTYYRAPKPGAPPYVEVGSVVEEDTIVGIIEVMKLMNTVRAGARGRVTDILARDGTLVEYGETLLRIAKSG